MPGNPFWAYWYFHVPNYLLAVLIYTLLGRFLLGLFLPPDSPNYIWRFFRLLTDWLVRLARLITPGLFIPAFLPPIAAFWLFALRLALFVGLAAAGAAPRANAP